LQVAQQLQQQNDKIVVLTHQGQANKGSAETRNVGIRAACYELVAFIDADDWFLPNRFANTRRIFAENPDSDGVYEAVQNIFTNTALSYSKTVSLDSVPDMHMVSKAVPPERLLEQLIDDPIGIIMLQGLCVKKSLFQQAGLFDARFRVFEDMLLVKKMATVGKLYGGSLYQPVSARRIHDTNISFSTFKDTDTKKYQEGEVLLQWALRQQVTSEKMNAIVRFNYRLYFYARHKPFSHKPTKLKWLFTTLFRFPKTLLFKQYWAVVPFIGKFIKP
jgi:glycosyltransferase involved in cell wall biosynthesis